MSTWRNSLLTSLLTATVAAALLSPRPARAQDAGYQQGSTTLGIGLAAGSGHFVALASGGYFVDPHLELGLLAEGTYASNQQSWGEVSPYLQAYLLTRPPVTPFVRLSAGRVFVESQEDGWVLHGGVGAAIFIGSSVTLTVEVYRERWYLPPAGPDDRTDYRLGIGVLFH